MARWQNPSTTTPDGLSLRPTANARLIVLDNDDVWDIAEGKLIQLGSLAPLGMGSVVEGSLSGNYLLLTTTAFTSSTAPYTTAGFVYDTTTLPIR